jgi:hypothetical protein
LWGRVTAAIDETCRYQSELDAEARRMAAQGYLRFGDERLSLRNQRIYNPSPKSAVGFFVPIRRFGEAQL